MGKIVYSKTKNIMIFLILKVWVGFTPQSISDPDPPHNLFLIPPQNIRRHLYQKLDTLLPQLLMSLLDSTYIFETTGGHQQHT